MDEDLISSTQIDKNRVIGFTDAVFAFSATLLVLKIDLPNLVQANIDSQLLAALWGLWPSYLANVICFLIIGYYWLLHHSIFASIRRIDHTLFWLNIIFLITVAFLPFPVDLYGDYPESKGVLIFFSGALALVGFTLLGLWFYALSQKLIKEHATPGLILYNTLRIAIAPSVFLLSIILTYIDKNLAQFSWILVIVGAYLIEKYARPQHH